MAKEFVSAITDEAMERICYNGGGWELTPFQFAVSEKDVLEGVPSIIDGTGRITDVAYEKLKEMTTDDLNSDDLIWCQLPFSSCSKVNDMTLAHHITIPPNLTIDSDFKKVKTIYFLYKAHDESIFLYAVARALEDIEYENGIVQSHFFNFTVTNANTSSEVDFLINYTYPTDIESHNTDVNSHENLVSRDGSRNIEGILAYDQSFNFTNSKQLVSKQYVDDLVTSSGGIDISITEYINALLALDIGIPVPTLDNNLNENEIWLEGATVLISNYMNLYTRYGTKYNKGDEPSGYFTLPDLRGRVLWGAEANDFGYIKPALPNIKGSIPRQNVAQVTLTGSFYKDGTTGNGVFTSGSYGIKDVYFDASRSSSIYKDNVNTVQPPAIKVRWKTRYQVGV